MTSIHVGIVIKAGGVVPFDTDLPADIKTHIIGHLVETGHTLEHAPDGSHVKLLSGPLKPQGA